jgi:hypothetical protein
MIAIDNGLAAVWAYAGAELDMAEFLITLAHKTAIYFTPQTAGPPPRVRFARSACIKPTGLLLKLSAAGLGGLVSIKNELAMLRLCEG